MKNLLTFTEENHEYGIFSKQFIHVPSVSELLDTITPDSKYIADSYAIRGTNVHQATEDYDIGQYVAIDDTVIPYMIGYDNFHNEHDVDFIETEQMVFSHDMFFAGRLDRLWQIDGRLHLTDIKTSQKQAWHVIQLVAYDVAHECTDKKELSSLYLSPFGYTLHIWSDEEIEKAYDMLDSLCNIYWWNHKMNYKRLLKLRDAI